MKRLRGVAVSRDKVIQAERAAAQAALEAEQAAANSDAANSDAAE